MLIILYIFTPVEITIRIFLQMKQEVISQNYIYIYLHILYYIKTRILYSQLMSDEQDEESYANDSHEDSADDVQRPGDRRVSTDFLQVSA